MESPGNETLIPPDFFLLSAVDFTPPPISLPPFFEKKIKSARSSDAPPVASLVL